MEALELIFCQKEFNAQALVINLQLTSTELSSQQRGPHLADEMTPGAPSRDAIARPLLSTRDTLAQHGYEILPLPA
jgi:hypothetical protein